MTTVANEVLPEAGQTFTADGRTFTVLGWFTDTGFVHRLFTYEEKPYGGEPFKWVQRWTEQNADGWYFELTDDMGLTVLDLVVRGWKNIPDYGRPEDS
jgi:hypothetical protein